MYTRANVILRAIRKCHTQVVKSCVKCCSRRVNRETRFAPAVTHSHHKSVKAMRTRPARHHRPRVNTFIIIIVINIPSHETRVRICALNICGIYLLHSWPRSHAALMRQRTHIPRRAHISEIGVPAELKRGERSLAASHITHHAVQIVMHSLQHAAKWS